MHTHTHTLTISSQNTFHIYTCTQMSTNRAPELFVHKPQRSEREQHALTNIALDMSNVQPIPSLNAVREGMRDGGKVRARGELLTNPITRICAKWTRVRYRTSEQTICSSMNAFAWTVLGAESDNSTSLYFTTDQMYTNREHNLEYVYLSTFDDPHPIATEQMRSWSKAVEISAVKFRCK
jgi:hypothetical protein